MVSFFSLSILLNVILSLLIWFILKDSLIKTKCKDLILYNKILLSNVIKEVKSGDLLLFSNYKYKVVSRTLGNPSFGHLGMVMMKDGIPYSIELVYNDIIFPGQPKQRNVIINKLEDRINAYSGYIFHSKLVNDLNDMQKIKLIELSKQHVTYNLSNQCGSYIANLIEELGIAENIYTKKFWKIHNNIINLTKNNVYSHPIQIISDNLLINSIHDNKMINFCKNVV